MTLYTVLQQAAEEGWKVYRESVEARSSDDAIRRAIDGSVAEGKYVAVPSRSWEPKSVKVETRITLS